MAYINLLPPEERKRGLNRNQSIVALGFGFYIMILIWISIFNKAQLTHLRIEAETLENQVKMVQPSLRRVGELEKQQKLLQDKLDQSKGLHNEMYFSKLMFTISGLTPESMFLKRLTYQGAELSFDGEAADYRTIALFADGLKNCGFFSAVEILSSFTNDIDGSVGFKIVGKFNVKN